MPSINPTQFTDIYSQGRNLNLLDQIPAKRITASRLLKLSDYIWEYQKSLERALQQCEHTPDVLKDPPGIHLRAVYTRGTNLTRLYYLGENRRTVSTGIIKEAVFGIRLRQHHDILNLLGKPFDKNKISEYNVRVYQAYNYG